VERRLAAIVAADLVGYSRLMGEDEAGTISAVSHLITATIEPLVTRHGGRIVKLMGDGILAEFASVVDAVKCSIEWQELISREVGKFRFRIGINLGDIVIQDGDIFGNGVNIAARLEGLAEPGGICVSNTVYEEVKGKLNLICEDLGQQAVKNIADPIRVYRVKGGEQTAAFDVRQGTGFSLPDKPSIAVLPFTNMSNDPEQEYFSDGITEDIITELSRFSELFVIARNSSFVFKGKSFDIKDAARKLGVQYIVEGSVRKAGNRVRVTAQLIDAVAGAHLWADRYDRQLEDIFDVQDDVVRAVVAVLPGRIAEAGAELVRRKPTDNLTAFDYLLRGQYELARRGNGIRKAIDYYHRAIEIDPDCAAAYAGIAVAEGMSVWDLSTYDDNPLERAYEAAKRALELDPSDYRSHAAFGEAVRQLGQHSVAGEHLQRAMKLNPNSTQVLGYWAMLQAYTGEPESAVETYNRAIRLDPFSQDNLRKEILAESYYMMGEYQLSIDVLESMLKLPIFYAHQQIAIAYAQLGNTQACNYHMEKYRASLPESYDEELLFESHLRLCARQQDRDHWRDGYRLIGQEV